MGMRTGRITKKMEMTNTAKVAMAYPDNMMGICVRGSPPEDEPRGSYKDECWGKYIHLLNIRRSGPTRERCSGDLCYRKRRLPGVDA